METEKIKILLVDDDAFFTLIVKKYLTDNGFLVDAVSNAKDGLDLFLKNTYHLCLLDVVMPQKDGYALAKEMKTVNKNIPIVFITSNNTKEQAIKGFNMGADAYLRKPFPMEELLVRMQAILRRSLKPHGVEHEIEKFNIGKYIFNYSAQILTCNNMQQRLTTKEAELLHLLVLKKNQLLDRSFALKTIWHNIDYSSRRSMDVFVGKLRKFFKNDEQIKIVNVPKRGYILSVKA